MPVYCLQRLRVECQFLRSTTGTPWADADPRSLFLGMGSALLPPRLGELGAAGATNLQLWRRP